MRLRKPSQGPRSAAFTAIESLAMLVTLFVFSMIVAALWLRYQRDPDSMPRLSQLRPAPLGAEAPVESSQPVEAAPSRSN